ncbi:MAG: hypothetical protein WCP93_03660 [Candidatus Berkelbacteria bacterium]
MNRNKNYFKWMYYVAGGSLLLHYLILWIFKTDESFLFLLAFVVSATAVTTWIFDYIDKRKGR